MSTLEHDADPIGGARVMRLPPLDEWAQRVGATLPPADHPRHVAAVDPPAADAVPFRPTVRRPMALLRVVDDDSEEGELLRIRQERFVIGRSEGDVVVPHDISMSPRHAAIERLGEAGWRLSDLGSAGGTFVRVTTARLRDGTVLQVGRTRLRFQAVDLTEAWLIEDRPDRSGTRHECHAPGTLIGRGGCGCGISLDDPFVSPIHADIRRTHRGWTIDNAGMNGLWVRIEAPVRMAAAAQFLCGEQRFVFMPCG
jgi:pSer/pThr/pTyr-binding forkhead associated (FHA) protein